MAAIGTAIVVVIATASLPLAAVGRGITGSGMRPATTSRCAVARGTRGMGEPGASTAPRRVTHAGFSGRITADLTLSTVSLGRRSATFLARAVGEVPRRRTPIAATPFSSRG